MFCGKCGTWASDDAARCPLCGTAFHGGSEPAAEPTAISRAFSTAQAGTVEAAGLLGPAVTYGGFWRRFAAVVLDSLVLWFPSATVRVWLGLDPLAVFDPQSPLAWVAAGAEWGVGWLYAALMLRSSARATLGLQVMDLQVTDLRGARLSFVRATWRYVAQLFTLLTFGVGYLLQLFTPRRQTLHDLLSATVVVRRHPVPVPAYEPLVRATG